MDYNIHDLNLLKHAYNDDYNAQYFLINTLKEKTKDIFERSFDLDQSSSWEYLFMFLSGVCNCALIFYLTKYVWEFQPITFWFTNILCGIFLVLSGICMLTDGKMCNRKFRDNSEEKMMYLTICGLCVIEWIFLWCFPKTIFNYIKHAHKIRKEMKELDRRKKLCDDVEESIKAENVGQKFLDYGLQK